MLTMIGTTLFVFILLPVTSYAMGTVGRKSKANPQYKINGELMSQVEETLSGLRK